ncbi:hypothetical protein SAMN02745130_03655 [Thiothrix eikelboomii]|uniref:DinB superfamily protein n=1 Tax=Thiothrix eikelboomii TaxID=92487 RepID=A0A1T4XXR3_9GAMM|nr:hypothetical protein [Thiothrix eikelboomii]SKA94336.1 hypothetical protein SAMN02745130_03655 [Thiothrix eikelboomii]
MQQDLSVVVLRHLKPILEMLRHTILTCPEQVFAGDKILVREQLYHALVGMDVWFSDKPNEYNFNEILDIKAAQMHGIAPPHISRRFLLAYLGKIEHKLAAMPMKPEKFLEIREIGGREMTYLDQCLVQMRHVQHHLGEVDEIMRSHQLPLLEWRGYGEYLQ